MKKVEHDLLTEENTEVRHEELFTNNAPHNFEVHQSSENYVDPKLLQKVHFQEGPVKEVGLNGVFNEDLIHMVICRLEHFQKSNYACRENAVAITKLEEALMWLRKRNINRNKRGVVGTHKI
jgi:hypothetical protein